MNNMNQKNIIVEIDEVKQELVAIINKAANERGVPFYMIEMIIAPLHEQLYAAASRELQAAKMPMVQTDTNNNEGAV